MEYGIAADNLWSLNFTNQCTNAAHDDEEYQKEGNQSAQAGGKKKFEKLSHAIVGLQSAFGSGFQVV